MQRSQSEADSLDRRDAQTNEIATRLLGAVDESTVPAEKSGDFVHEDEREYHGQEGLDNLGDLDELGTSDAEHCLDAPLEVAAKQLAEAHHRLEEQS